MGNKAKSDFLTSSPSFISGAGRLLDWYGQFDEYNKSRDGREADSKAAASDWEIVGDDLRKAMADFQIAG